MSTFHCETCGSDTHNAIVHEDSPVRADCIHMTGCKCVDATGRDDGISPSGSDFAGLMRDVATAGEDCGHCYRCIGNKPVSEGSWLTVGMTRMIVCADCGNKRCPHSTDHRLACTSSNEGSQPGSRYQYAENHYEIQYRPPSDPEGEPWGWDWESVREEYESPERAWEWVDHLAEVNEEYEYRVVRVTVLPVDGKEKKMSTSSTYQICPLGGCSVSGVHGHGTEARYLPSATGGNPEASLGTLRPYGLPEGAIPRDGWLRSLQHEAWVQGMRMGASRAMRHMSDEPGLPLATEADSPYA